MPPRQACGGQYIEYQCSHLRNQYRTFGRICPQSLTEPVRLSSARQRDWDDDIVPFICQIKSSLGVLSFDLAVVGFRDRGQWAAQRGEKFARDYTANQVTAET